MKARSRDRTTENSALAYRGEPLVATSRAKTVPPNLAEIYPEGRKTKGFRSSKATDMLIFGSKSTTIDKRDLSMVRARTGNHTMWRTTILI
ncbi:hypothetical protein GGE16_005802 [Rhizobium leguminosarum]|uniref:Uncharacterized protein n=1 Tax=Rhizobium leguminosarum TaxID=384 RepID=A0AAE2MQV2_RHILE|nr:hypothetical protein RHEC894_PB00005 [Rhizobium sp. CIAT894]MBB4293708.1 hypothetical protein [Rhizobium leguminosarum]MBB4435188.1 hypothetical protein [Rhizobium esperanzae]MBB4299308.1 hypothetical protein [Rhizobium leguminosarum]MBB4310807.1 hypothetical protein [Rhizobium leguminosarum]